MRTSHPKFKINGENLTTSSTNKSPKKYLKLTYKPQKIYSCLDCKHWGSRTCSKTNLVKRNI